MNTLKISSTFKLVFFTVVSLTLLSGGTSLWLASQPQLSSEQNRIFESCSTTWQLGTGAIFGLLGGKAADALHQEEEE
ncbi:MAG: hypothetical protein JO235_28970 [Chroococcidiopsidaceae cyanobacterium CP_BM_RX_35]|nr:hypothetical protein [Chroococcidiopsidaceae cyanobacterium CP_BM_RX_35]